jgi:hypothetical protein
MAADKIAEQHRVLTQKSASELGQAAVPVQATTTKQASDSLNSNYVGRRTSDLKQSDINFFQTLGLPIPQ